jgi:hypothetical protein
MKIESITFIEAGSVPFVTRNTKTNQNVQTVLDNINKAPVGKWLVISLTPIEVTDPKTKKTSVVYSKQFERYSLQKALQKKGAHVLVSNGTNPTTLKPALLIRRLSDKEWAEWQKENK